MGVLLADARFLQLPILTVEYSVRDYMNDIKEALGGSVIEIRNILEARGISCHLRSFQI